MPTRTRRRTARPTTRPRRAGRGAGTGEVADRSLGFYAFHVRDVMTRKVVTVGEADSLEEAARRMVIARVSGLPVLSRAGRLVGVVSQKDIVRLLNARAGLTVPRGLFDLLLDNRTGETSEIAAAARRVLEEARVRDAMSRPAISVRADTPLDEAIGLLISNKINRLPVVTQGAVVGIVTRHDLLAGVSESL
ncbi:MAG TPA: CBS domain-containing protein [Thermoplasmata archaeon]|nr:CBS domain-containing protein [Thermoplasmata archaeon]